MTSGFGLCIKASHDWGINQINTLQMRNKSMKIIVVSVSGERQIFKQHTHESKTLFSFFSTKSSPCMRWLALKADNEASGFVKRGKEKRKEEMRKDSGIVSGSGRGVIYLVHLRRTAGLQRRQPRPATALTSCLALKGQQRINQTENKQRKYDEAAKISNNFGVTTHAG